MTDIKRRDTNARMSKSVSYGNLVFLAGQVGEPTSAGVQAQTREVLAKIDAALADAGSDKSKLLSANIWLTDITTWSQMNEVWDAWVSPGNTPARATVETKLAGPQYKVEIMVQAAK